MDTTQYIASGILEQYAFGLLPKEEIAEVEANLAQYPELQAELREIEYTLEAYLSLNKATLTPGFYPSLEDKLAQVEPDPTPSVTSEPPPPTPPVRGGVPWLAGALFFLALAGLAFLWTQNQAKDQALADSQAALTALQQDCDADRAESELLRQQISILRTPGNRLVPMNGTDKAPDALASVIYNSTNQVAYLDISNLPTPPSDKQYQLWAIVDGSPVDMGVFDLPLQIADDLQIVPFIPEAQAFAVTLEPVGGSENPTLEEMVVIGNVG